MCKVSDCYMTESSKGVRKRMMDIIKEESKKTFGMLD